MGPLYVLEVMSLLLTLNAQSDAGCLFDPCIIPDFCHNSGTCVLNTSECSAFCVCTDEFTGSRCEQMKSESNPQGGATNCPVNPCSTVSPFCQNGGTCILHEETCNFTCTCADGYTGVNCEAKNSSRISGTTCQTSGTLCLNGECLFSESEDLLGTVTETCQCHDGWAGHLCDIQVAQQTDSTSDNATFSNESTGVGITTISHESVNDVCSTLYVNRSVSERTCDGILTCVFGACRKKLLEGESWSGYSYVCECDKSAEGTYCDQKCCMECGDHGTCTVLIDTTTMIPTEHCECAQGWFGPHCNTTELEHETSIQVTTTTPTVASELIDDRFNACSEHYVERSKADKTCNGMFWGHECTFGTCKRELVRDENWAGYSYACDCDHGAQGTYCDYKCCLDCGDHGKCAIIEYPNTTSSEHCDCKPNYDGERCEIFVPDPVQIKLRENTWYMYVVGACALTFVLLMILAVVAPYMMWKHRVILIMKIVHYFRAYEDDDEREWDAFVSYKADDVDEHFVVHTLFPKLEKELGFKLCLHFRDFVPGETIANNIINAVEGSRRTILILTPRYVESEFTRFEYEKAQQEMLRRKHRIIPLVLEDISSVTPNMDKTLRNIIESVTYLEWPQGSSNESSKREEKFWKRLHLSMPKKKDSVSSMSSHLSNNVTSAVSNTNSSSDCFVNLSILSEPGKTPSDSVSPIFDSEAYSEKRYQTERSVSSGYGRSYSSSGESCSTMYSEISDVDIEQGGDINVSDEIPTLSEDQEAELGTTC